MPSSHLILWRPLLLLPSIFPSIRVFSNESVGQSIGASASASVLPMKIQDWFPLGLTGWISLQSKGLSRVFSNTTVQKHQFFGIQFSLWSKSHIHTWPYITTGKTIDLTRWTFVSKVMSLFFNMLSKFVIYLLWWKNYLFIYFDHCLIALFSMVSFECSYILDACPLSEPCFAKSSPPL